MVDYAVGELGFKQSEADIVDVVNTDHLCDLSNYEQTRHVNQSGINVVLPDACTAIMSSYED